MIRLVMERAGLTLWPMLSLLIFLASSLAIVIWLYRPGSKTFYQNLARMALDEDQALKGKG
jgi:cbb3-type cytochrome oxidase subunit 3